MHAGYKFVKAGKLATGIQGKECDNSPLSLAARLEAMASERAIVTKAGVPLLLLTEVKHTRQMRMSYAEIISEQECEWMSDYQVMDAEAAQTWHIVHNIENISLVNPAELEEVVITVQGIIY